MYLALVRTGNRLTALGLVSPSRMHVRMQESKISGFMTSVQSKFRTELIFIQLRVWEDIRILKLLSGMLI